MEPTHKKTVGSYQLGECLAEGGEGQVFRAVCEKERPGVACGEEVALKKLWTSTHGVERETSEATILKSLKHPNVVRYRDDFHQKHGLVNKSYLVTELLEGQTLKKLLSKHPHGLPWEQVKIIFEQVLKALIYTSSRGVVHRDIKPHNIFVTHTNVVKLLDFGIARQVDAALDFANGRATIKGTLDYKAPEATSDGFQEDEQSDVFSFGVCFYEALTGKLPLPALQGEKTFAHIQRWHGDAPPPAIVFDENDFNKHPDPFEVKEFLIACLAVERSRRLDCFVDVRDAFNKLIIIITGESSERYELLELIGGGGFGNVYKARRLSDNMLVAAKLLSDDRHAKRFSRECHILQRVDDDHIVRYLDKCDEQHSGNVNHYLVMEYLPGMPEESLHGRLRRSPMGLEVQQTLRLFICYLSGLSKLHQNKIYHRDIKPGNLYAPEGNVDGAKIIDLGIAMDQEGSKITVFAGNRPASIDYVAPEYFKIEEHGNELLDIFSLGVTLYQTLTGQLPWPRIPEQDSLICFRRRWEHSSEVMFKDLFKQDLFHQYPELPKILTKALSINPEGRYQSAEEMRQALRQCLNSIIHPITAEAVTHNREQDDEAKTIKPEQYSDGRVAPPTVYTDHIYSAAASAIIYLKDQLAVVVTLLAAILIIGGFVASWYYIVKPWTVLSATNKDARIITQINEFIKASQQTSADKLEWDKWVNAWDLIGKHRAGRYYDQEWRGCSNEISKMAQRLPNEIINIATNTLILDELKQLELKWVYGSKYYARINISDVDYERVATVLTNRIRDIENREEQYKWNNYKKRLVPFMIASNNVLNAEKLYKEIMFAGTNKWIYIKKQVDSDIENLLAQMAKTANVYVTNTLEPAAKAGLSLQPIKQFNRETTNLASLARIEISNVTKRVQAEISRNRHVIARNKYSENKIEEGDEEHEEADKISSDVINNEIVINAHKDVEHAKSEAYGRLNSLETSLDKLRERLRNASINEMESCFNELNTMKNNAGVLWGNKTVLALHHEIASVAAASISNQCLLPEPIDGRSERLEALNKLLNTPVIVILGELAEHLRIRLKEEQDIYIIKVNNESGQDVSFTLDDKRVASIRKAGFANYRLSASAGDHVLAFFGSEGFRVQKKIINITTSGGVEISVGPFIPSNITVQVCIEQPQDRQRGLITTQWRTNAIQSWIDLEGGAVTVTPRVSMEFMFNRPDYIPVKTTKEVEIAEKDPTVKGPALNAWSPNRSLSLLKRAREKEKLDKLFKDNPPERVPFDVSANREEYNELYGRWLKQWGAKVEGERVPIEARIAEFRMALFQVIDPATGELRRQKDLPGLLAEKWTLLDLPDGLAGRLGENGAVYQRLALWRKYWAVLNEREGRIRLAGELADLAYSLQATNRVQADWCHYESILLAWDPNKPVPFSEKLSPLAETACWEAHAKFRDNKSDRQASLKQLVRFKEKGGRLNWADARLAMWWADGELSDQVAQVEMPPKKIWVNDQLITNDKDLEGNGAIYDTGLYEKGLRDTRKRVALQSAGVMTTLTNVVGTLQEGDRAKLVPWLIANTPWSAEVVRERLHWPLEPSKANPKKLDILRELLKASATP